MPRCQAILGGTTTLSDCLIAVRCLVNPRRLIRGPALGEYERAFAARIGVRYAFSFASGRVGLYAILRSLGLGADDEVLLQVPTHIVVANAVRYTEARPVYVDCLRDTYNLDFDHAEKRVTSRTKALILQHTFGNPADLDAAQAFAARHGLELIEDCVHALGARYSGRPVGSFGRAAFFSTEETKTISTTMGGIVTTDDSRLAGRLAEFQAGCAWPFPSTTARHLVKLVLYHGLTHPYVHRHARAIYDLAGKREPLPGPTTAEEKGGLRPPRYEQRLSNAQALLGLRQLRRLDANLGHRRRVSDLYGAQLSALGLRVPRISTQAEPSFVRYPVWVADRPATMRAVAPFAALGAWFSSVLQEAASPEAGEYVLGTCPTAESAARHLVNLPTHPRVSEVDAAAIVGVVPAG